MKEVLEKYKVNKLIKSNLSPLSSTSVSSGYIVVSEYQGGDSSYASCEGTPYNVIGVALGLCVAVNSGYSDLPYGCPTSGSYLKLTASLDGETVYLTYSYFSSSACSTSCGSYTYSDIYNCNDGGYYYYYGAYESYSTSFTNSVVVPSVAGILQQEYVSSSCTGTLAGYIFAPTICRSFFGYYYELTCSSDNNELSEMFYYDAGCSGVPAYSYTQDFSYTCTSYPYATIADSFNSSSNNTFAEDSYYYYYYYYYNSYYYSDDGFIGGESTYYKQSCQTSSSTSSSSSSSSALSQAGVIAVSVGSGVVFLIIVGLVVFLIFNYCPRNASYKNNNNNNNTTIAVEIIDVNRNVLNNNNYNNNNYNNNEEKTKKNKKDNKIKNKSSSSNTDLELNSKSLNV
jgi:hypothetical protein